MYLNIATKLNIKQICEKNCQKIRNSSPFNGTRGNIDVDGEDNDDDFCVHCDRHFRIKLWYQHHQRRQPNNKRMDLKKETITAGLSHENSYTEHKPHTNAKYKKHKK